MGICSEHLYSILFRLQGEITTGDSACTNLAAFSMPFRSRNMLEHPIPPKTILRRGKKFKNSRKNSKNVCNGKVCRCLSNREFLKS